MHPAKLPKLPMSLKIAYALGQFGWSFSTYAVFNLINFFYFPAESHGKVLFPPFIIQTVFFGFVTAIGGIVAFGRLFDAFIDPLIANLSDKATSHWGRRRFFMIIGVLPTPLLGFLIFTPPVFGEAVGNIIWFAVTSFLFYISFAMYTIPYTALLSELGHDSKERLQLSTMIGVTWAAGFASGNLIYAIQEPLQTLLLTQGVHPALIATRAFQTSVGLFSLIGFFFMLLPIIFINEKKYCDPTPTHLSTIDAVKATVANRNFVTFVGADFIYWLALTFVQSGVSYYVTILLDLPTKFTSTVLTVMFVASFVFFWPTTVLATRYGKKPILIVGFIMFAAVFTTFGIYGWFGTGGDHRIAWISAGLAAIPMAIFTILPNATIADIAEQHAQDTGEHQAGMFFATRTLTMKAAAAVAALIFPTVLALGKSSDNPTGIRMTAVIAMALCIVGFVIMTRFKEPSDESDGGDGNSVVNDGNPTPTA